MLKFRVGILLLLACCAGPLLAQEAPQEQLDAAFFTKLRMGYALGKTFTPLWEINKERVAVIATFDAKDFPKAYELANLWLAKNPTDSRVHLLCAASAREVGDLKGFLDHQFFAAGLLQSIVQSGDGQTPKTAFRVISVVEEFALFENFGAKVAGAQRQLHEQGGVYDKIDCVLPNGKPVTYYFDVSIPTKALEMRQKGVSSAP